MMILYVFIKYTIAELMTKKSEIRVLPMIGDSENNKWKTRKFAIITSMNNVKSKNNPLAVL